MFIAKYNTADGKQIVSLYYGFEFFFKDTFSPLTTCEYMLEFKLWGRTYRERKDAAKTLAIEYSHLDLSGDVGLSYGELCDIQGFFERAGRRYGLLREFRENCIC